MNYCKIRNTYKSHSPHHNLPNKQIIADLAELASKHPKAFNNPSDVYRLLTKVKEEPNHFYHNNNPKVALIGKDLDDGKLGRIGIQKDYESDYLKVKHAQRIDAKRNEKLLNRAKLPLVETADSTHPLSTNSSRYMPTGANALSKDNGIIPQNAVSLENKNFLNQRIKGFANALDENSNPQNIEVKDIRGYFISKCKFYRVSGLELR